MLSSETDGLVSLLLEGPSNAGKSTLAAELAKLTKFASFKLVSLNDMVGFNETMKCL